MQISAPLRGLSGAAGFSHEVSRCSTMTDRVRYALSIAAVAASLAGCAPAAESSLAPAAVQEQIPTGPYARSLLYAAAGSTEVFTYPHGKPVGYLGVFDAYLCSDSSGNIFATGDEGLGYVWVFAHGSSTPFATIYNPQSAGGCSVDPSSETVAVADPDASPIVIFPYNPRRGWRLARQYSDANMRGSFYCTYDSQGNLFVDGYDTNLAFILVELPKGSSTFTTITLDQTIHSPGSLQWVGNDLALEDAGTTRSSTAVIYRFAITGSGGHKLSRTALKDSVGNAQFLIRNGTVIGPLAGAIGFWRFPRGGAPVRTIPTYGNPHGEALSLK